MSCRPSKETGQLVLTGPDPPPPPRAPRGGSVKATLGLRVAGARPAWAPLSDWLEGAGWCLQTLRHHPGVPAHLGSACWRSACSSCAPLVGDSVPAGQLGSGLQPTGRNSRSCLRLRAKLVFFGLAGPFAFASVFPHVSD